MTRIDFYVLSDSDDESRNLLVCKLAEKAFRHGKPVFIHSDNIAMLESLDQKLWQFRSNSFVPHRLIEGGDQTFSSTKSEADPVQLSTGEPGQDRRVLINLASSVPAFFSRFERALEVVNQAGGVRESGRERYRFYQQRGYPLQHHKM